jgi:hypothetical protein
MKIIIGIFLFKDILLTEILKIGDIISTVHHSIIFDSKEFLEGESMNFKFTIKNNISCQEKLLYEYYDDINLIANNNTAKYSTFPTFSQSNNTTLYYTIRKKEEELNGKKGDYLLIVFNCADSSNRITIENLLKNKKIRIIESVTGTNNKTNLSSSSSDGDFDLIVSIVFPLWAVFVIIFTVVCCCWDTVQKVEKLDNMINGGGTPNPSPSPENSSSKENKDNDNIENYNNDNNSSKNNNNNSSFIHIKNKGISNKGVSSDRRTSHKLIVVTKKNNK